MQKDVFKSMRGERNEGTIASGAIGEDLTIRFTKRSSPDYPFQKIINLTAQSKND